MKESKFLLGKMPAISHLDQLVFSNYYKSAAMPPDVYNYWSRRKAFTRRMFGNDKIGDCTRAAQANAQMRMERIENNNSVDINIPDSEVIRVYYAMTKKYYGGGDTGAYEIDALSCWRKPDETFKDVKGNPYTIDAFTKINQANQIEVKNAICLSAAHGIKICLNLPIAWQGQQNLWSIPKGQKPIGNYTPGSWGGHCLAGETVVHMLNGTDVSIKQLADSGLKDFWVYGSSTDGKFVPVKAQCAAMTKISKTVTVNFDNGEFIRCTPCHLFMLRDGSYVRADGLQYGNSLMPLYKRIVKNKSHNGYQQIALGGKYEFTHLLVGEYLGFKRGHDYVVHHKGIGEINNRLNNVPENLESMTWQAHRDLHSKFNWADTYNKTEQGRNKSKELMNRLWSDPVWKAERLEKMKQYRPDIRTVSKEWNKTEEGKAHFRKIGNTQGADNLRRSNERRRVERINCVCATCSKEFTRKVTEINGKKTFCGVECSLINSRSFSPLNHKVVSVIENNIEEPVYDLINVESTHNFAANGVFVHNSLFCQGYDKEGLFLPTWDIMPKITWEAFAIYCDEAYSIVDSIDSWKKRVSKKVFDIPALKSDVNQVSSMKLK